MKYFSLLKIFSVLCKLFAQETNFLLKINLTFMISICLKGKGTILKLRMSLPNIKEKHLHGYVTDCEM